MKRLRKDLIREQRIQNEVVAGACGPEQAMGWYYYLENNLRFSFQAQCVVRNWFLRSGQVSGSMHTGARGRCLKDMLVSIRWQKRNLVVPLSQLTPTGSDDTTREAIADWHYWVSQRLPARKSHS